MLLGGAIYHNIQNSQPASRLVRLFLYWVTICEHMYTDCNLCSASQSGSGSPNVMGGGQVTALGSYTPLTLGLITTSMWGGKKEIISIIEDDNDGRTTCVFLCAKFCIQEDTRINRYFTSTRTKYFCNLYPMPTKPSSNSKCKVINASPKLMLNN